MLEYGKDFCTCSFWSLCHSLLIALWLRFFIFSFGSLFNFILASVMFAPAQNSTSHNPPPPYRHDRNQVLITHTQTLPPHTWAISPRQRFMKYLFSADLSPDMPHLWGLQFLVLTLVYFIVLGFLPCSSILPDPLPVLYFSSFCLVIWICLLSAFIFNKKNCALSALFVVSAPWQHPWSLPILVFWGWRWRAPCNPLLQSLPQLLYGLWSGDWSCLTPCGWGQWFPERTKKTASIRIEMVHYRIKVIIQNKFVFICSESSL